jgi:hypothetical protein
MDGFRKIDLDRPKKQSPVLSKSKQDMIKPMRAKRKFSFGKNARKIAIGVAVFVLLFVVFVVFPAVNTYKSARATYRQAKIASDAMKQQNVKLAHEELKKTQVSLLDTQKNLKAMWYLKFVPIVNFYYNDADHAVQAGVHGLNAAEISVNAIEPYADVLGLKGQGSFAMGSAEDRIKTAVMTMGKITPKIDEISDDLVKMRDELDQVNPNHYPEFIFGKKIKTQLTQAKELTDQGVTFIDQARPLVKVLPELLGEKEDKKYLILFQNDKELRPTGGFITAYAILKVDKGVISIDKNDDIYPIDDSIPNKPEAPDQLKKYLKVNRLNLRDSNLSPDFVTSMKTFQDLYNKSPQATKDIDGIIAIDTNVLVSTIKVLDDTISAGGLTFNTKIDPRCDCPQVIYELEDNISRPVNYIKTDRKGLLGQLLVALMQKALTSSPKVYWGPLFQTLLAETQQKHVMFYLFDEDAQKGIEGLNAAGQIRPFEGDYLYINDANLGGQKSNLFVDQSVTQSYKVEGDGTILKTVTIDYVNPHAPSDCNLERGGLCLNAELRDWIRIYVPKGSELVSSKGSQTKVTTYDEFGKTVIDGFTTVRPRGKATYSVTYKLPFKLKKGSPLPLMIQKQGGKEAFPYTIDVDGRKIQELNLDTDKELQLKI